MHDLFSVALSLVLYVLTFIFLFLYAGIKLISNRTRSIYFVLSRSLLEVLLDLLDDLLDLAHNYLVPGLSGSLRGLLHNLCNLGLRKSFKPLLNLRYELLLVKVGVECLLEFQLLARLSLAVLILSARGFLVNKVLAVSSRDSAAVH